jgi:RING-H2 zinc finger domain/PTB domain (IRS-1 type)
MLRFVLGGKPRDDVAPPPFPGEVARFHVRSKSLGTAGDRNKPGFAKKKSSKTFDAWIAACEDSVQVYIRNPAAKNAPVVLSHPWAHLKRWAAAADSFTLDFGEYEADFLTFLTDEGDAIARCFGEQVGKLVGKAETASGSGSSADFEAPGEAAGEFARFSSASAYFEGGRKAPAWLVLCEGEVTVHMRSQKPFSHPWKELLRWAATTSAFVIDFGEFEEGNLTFETADAEAISAAMSEHVGALAAGKTANADREQEAPKYESSDDDDEEKCEDSFDDLAGDDVPECPFNVAALLRDTADGPIGPMCAICRNPMYTVEGETIIVEGSPCIECQANPTGRECPISVGTCKHIYHFHCICRWRRTRTVCPLDNIEWHTAARGTEMNDIPVVKSASKR